MKYKIIIEGDGVKIERELTGEQLMPITRILLNGFPEDHMLYQSNVQPIKEL